MGIVSSGFGGRRRSEGPLLPPGQYREEGFPVLSAGPTPRVAFESWELTVTDDAGVTRRWDWAALQALPAENVVVDLHCVTQWSKFGTAWRGVSLDLLLADVEMTAAYALVDCYGGYTTNLPLSDLRGGKAWIAFGYDGGPLHPEHGGPARLLVPHLYLWKSAKWVRAISLHREEKQGFWEQLGYHNYGDPWLEQRYADE